MGTWCDPGCQNGSPLRSPPRKGLRRASEGPWALFQGQVLPLEAASPDPSSGAPAASPLPGPQTSRSSVLRHRLLVSADFLGEWLGFGCGSTPCHVALSASSVKRPSPACLGPSTVAAAVEVSTVPRPPHPLPPSLPGLSWSRPHRAQCSLIRHRCRGHGGACSPCLEAAHPACLSVCSRSTLRSSSGSSLRGPCGSISFSCAAPWSTCILAASCTEVHTCARGPGPQRAAAPAPGRGRPLCLQAPAPGQGQHREPISGQLQRCCQLCPEKRTQYGL